MNYVNNSHKVIVDAIKSNHVEMRSPIMLTANQYDKEYVVSIDFMSTKVHIKKKDVDESEIRALNEDNTGYRFILNKVWEHKE